MREEWTHLIAAIALALCFGCRSAGTEKPDCVRRHPEAPCVSVEEHEPGAEREAKPRPEEIAAESQPAEEPLQNTVRWKTASEVDNFGFDVYRGDSEEGPFERLTAEPIPGAVTTDEPQTYVFEDDTIEAGRVYWYYVESISLAGVREKFTPVFASKPKGKPRSAPEN